MEAKRANFRALLPIAVFLVLYLGTGIWYEYISPVEGQPGFYIMSVVVAFILALMVAMLQNRSLNFDEKIRICAKGIGKTVRKPWITSIMNSMGIWCGWHSIAFF